MSITKVKILTEEIYQTYYKQLNQTKMKIQIKKETVNEIEVSCPTPKYVRFGERLYYKFHEEGNKIITTKFDFDGSSTYPFSMQVMTDLDINIFEAKGEYHTEVSEAEYYNNLRSLLQKYGVFDFNILAEEEVPTLFTQSN